MKTLLVHRKARFVGSAMPFWLVTAITKEELCRRYQFAGNQIADYHAVSPSNTSVYNAIGPFNAPAFHPEEVGIKLKNGQSVVLEIDENVTKSIFAVTKLGYFSNILVLPPERQDYHIQAIARWGWNMPGYPELTLLP